jgi:FKBP-type peptidyl-prolyl cis-trans isomerase
MKQQIFPAAALLALLGSASCNGNVVGLEPPSDPATETFAPSLGVDISQMTRQENGVYYKDIVVGTGLTLADTAVSFNVNYAGHLKDGKLFDSGTNQTLTLTSLVPGFRTGVLGMKEGGRRQIVIPSEEGYGGHSVRDPSTRKILIPRQSTLIFDVELLKVTNPTPAATTP